MDVAIPESTSIQSRVGHKYLDAFTHPLSTIYLVAADGFSMDFVINHANLRTTLGPLGIFGSGINVHFMIPRGLIL